MIKNLVRTGVTLCCLLAANAITTSASAVVMTFNNFADFQAASEGLMVETFDGAPWVDGSNPDAVVNLGVTWTAEDELIGETSISRSGSRSLTDGDPLSDNQEQINIELPFGIYAAGAFVDSYGQDHGVRMSASTQIADFLLGIVEGPATAAGSFSSFLGIISTERAIGRFSFNLPSGTPMLGTKIAIDDVYFGQVAQVAVPEPATLGLFAIGLAGLSFARRRKAALGFEFAAPRGVCCS